MTRNTSMTARRSFIFGVTALGLGLAVPALAQQASLPVPAAVDPWMGRDLNTVEVARLAELSELLTMKLYGAGVEIALLNNHLRVRLPASISYVKGKDHMSPEGVALMTLIAEAMSLHKRVRVEIVGHHDSRPPAYEAYVFTQRRAQAARAAIISRGIAADRIKATGLGVKFPFASPARSSENQRIELLFRPL